MNKFIYEIFDTIGNALPDMEQADKAITKEINNLLEPYKTQMTSEEWESLRDVLFHVSYCSKKESFAVGFYYAVELFLNKQL